MLWWPIFLFILKMVGPYIVEKLIDWIIDEMTGHAVGAPPALVRAQPKTAKFLRKVLKDEAQRELRLQMMRAAVAKAKKESYPVA